MKKKKEVPLEEQENIVIEGYENYSETSEIFNIDLDITGYMDVQKGISNIVEKREEFTEMDSSQEFHEWEKR